MKPLNHRTSAAMARVRQKKTRPEEAVALALRANGIRYRRNVRTLPGKPDFANCSKGWAINVHGCFWHQHDCKRGTMPAHNAALWRAKFETNRARDARVDADLGARGLRVFTVWECETQDAAALVERVRLMLGK